jgi:hypothetical protein
MTTFACQSALLQCLAYGPVKTSRDGIRLQDNHGQEHEHDRQRTECQAHGKQGGGRL